MIKLAVKAVIFLIGVGAGIFVAAHFPALAAQVSSAEDTRLKQAVAQAKVDILNQVVADQQAKTASPTNSLMAGASSMLGGGGAAPDPTLTKYQAMLNQSKADLAASSAK